jgi:hypothetical protein
MPSAEQIAQIMSAKSLIRVRHVRNPLSCPIIVRHAARSSRLFCGYAMASSICSDSILILFRYQRETKAKTCQDPRYDQR